MSFTFLEKKSLCFWNFTFAVFCEFMKNLNFGELTLGNQALFLEEINMASPVN